MSEIICISYEAELYGNTVIIKAVDIVRAADNPQDMPLELSLMQIKYGKRHYMFVKTM